METVEMTLTDFLLARIAEDEERAQCIVIEEGQDIPMYFEGRMRFRMGSVEATEDQWREFMSNAGAIRVDDPRLLAECEAKRRIVELHSDDFGPVTGDCYWQYMGTDDPCPTLRLLALPYADHPDYRQEWRP